MILVFCFGAEAGAKEGVFQRFKKPIPEVPLLSEKDFILATKLITKEPYGDESLAFKMRIDKTWEESERSGLGNVMLSEKLFQDVVKFYGKAGIGGRSRLEVQALNIEGALNAEQWYIKYMLEGGFTTQGLVTHDESKVESLMVVMERDYSFYLRTLVLINGSKVIMVKYYVPVSSIQAEAPMQAQVLASFKLKHKKSRIFPEVSNYRFLDVVEVKYPKTWKIYPKPMRTADRMEASLVNVRQLSTGPGQAPSISTQGKLDIVVLSSAANQSLVEQVDEFKKYIEGNGMLVGDKIEKIEKFTHSDSIDFAMLEVYEGTDSSSNLNEYELWYNVMVGGNYYYMMLLLTPSRNEDFSTWAENTQNFKLVIDQLRPMVGAFLDRD